MWLFEIWALMCTWVRRPPRLLPPGESGGGCPMASSAADHSPLCDSCTVTSGHRFEACQWEDCKIPSARWVVCRCHQGVSQMCNLPYDK